MEWHRVLVIAGGVMLGQLLIQVLSRKASKDTIIYSLIVACLLMFIGYQFY